MCSCGPYHSIIPPGPCPQHTAPVFRLVPMTQPYIWTEWTTDTLAAPVIEEYVGKHRKPE